MSFFGETFIVGNTLENNVNANGYGINNATNISFLPSGNLTSDGTQLLFNNQPIGGGGGGSGTVTSVSAGNQIVITGNPNINPTVAVSANPSFTSLALTANGGLCSLGTDNTNELLVNNVSIVQTITSNDNSVSITASGSNVDLSVAPAPVQDIVGGVDISVTSNLGTYTINYTGGSAITPNIEQVLTAGNNANYNSIQNVNSVSLLTASGDPSVSLTNDTFGNLAITATDVKLNGSYIPTSLVPGSNVTISNVNGAYTINASGGGGGGSVNSVTAGPSGNIVVAGTATDPTVDTSATPTFETIGVKNVNTLSATTLQQDSGAVVVGAVNLGAPAPFAGSSYKIRNALSPLPGGEVTMSLDSANLITTLSYNDGLATTGAIMEDRNFQAGSGVSIANPSAGVLSFSATGLQSLSSADANISVTTGQDPVIQLSQTLDVLTVTLNNPNSSPTSGTLSLNATHQLCLDGVVVGPGGAANLPITVGNTQGPKVPVDIIIGYNPDVPATIQKLTWTDDDSRGFLFDGNVNISGGLGCTNYIFAPDTSIPNLSVPYLYLDNQGVVQLDNTLNPFPQSVTTFNVGGNITAQGNVSADGQIATTGDLFAKQLFLNTSQSIGGITTSGPSLIVPTVAGFLNDLILYTPAAGNVSNLFTTGVLTQNYTGSVSSPDPTLGETVFSASYFPGYTSGHQFQTKTLTTGPWAHTNTTGLYASLNANLSQTPILNFLVAGTVDLTQITTALVTGTTLKFIVLLTSENVTFQLDNLSPTPTTVEVMRGESPYFVYSVGTTSWTYLGN